MRYLRLVILVSIFGFGLNTAAFAVCCPGGCVENGYGGCWVNGTNNYCAPTSSSCQGSSGSSSGGGSGKGGGWIGNGVLQPPDCGPANRTKATRDAATDQCVDALSASAQVFLCGFFEDAQNKLEDQKTGLSCFARQGALASQCRARCAAFAASVSNCYSQDQQWQNRFGDIGGVSYGSARVDLCGPPIRHGLLNRTGRGRRLTP
jgi:ribosomal protein L40E